MTIIPELSPDVLDLIIDKSKSFYVFLRLWLSGDRTLIAKLAQGVTRLRLESNSPLGVSQFPRAILSLRNLRRLSIKAAWLIVENPLDWRDITKSLPPSLERLRLSFPASNYALRDFDASATPHDLKYVQKPYPLGSSNLIDFQSVFPRLHTLKIDFGRGNFCKIDHADLSALPPSLTRLALGSLPEMKHRPFMSVLPRNLTRLDSLMNVARLSYDEIGEKFLRQDWALAPPHLQHISDLIVAEKPVDWIPATVTEANVVGSRNAFYQQNPSLELVRTLPRKLRCLRLYFGHSSPELLTHLLSAMPTSLVNLELHPIDDLQMTLSVPQLRLLPATLCHLKTMVDVDWMGLSDVMLDTAGTQINNIWPPHLQSLSVAPTRPDNLDKLLKCLPPSLVDLTFAFGALEDQDLEPKVLNASLLPNHLSSFTLSRKYIDAIVGSFPSSLTSFRSIDWRYKVDNLDLPPTLPDALQVLHTLSFPPNTPFPPNLKDINLKQLHYNRFGDIPKSTTSLRIQQLIGNSESPNHASELPVTLRMLHIVSVSASLKPALDRFDFSSLINLEELHLLCSFNTKATFPTLPKSLRVLEANWHAAVEDAVHLPQLLRSIVGIRWLGPRDQLARTFPPFAIASFPDFPPNKECIETVRRRLFSSI